MPKFKDLQIEICSDDKPLKEYGTNKLARNNMVSTWIESKSDQAFTIRIRTQRPWDYSENDTIKGDGRDPVQYSLCAHVHFDGRDSDPERSAVIYLDDDGGQTIKGKTLENAIRSSFVTRSDGTLEQQTWVFRDTGCIDHIFEKLCLASADMDEALQAEDELAKALKSTKISKDKEKDSAPLSKLGQIFINVQRVRVSRRKGVAGNSSHFATKKKDDDNDVDMGDDDDQITHRVASNTYTVMKPGDMRVINIVSYRDDLGPYAQFTFFYRSRKQLSKMGIIATNEAPSRSKRHKLGTVAAQMMSLNTLSEQKRLDKLPNHKISESFEDKVKNKTLGPYKDNGTSKYRLRPRPSDTRGNDSSEDEWEDVDESARRDTFGPPKSKIKALRMSRKENHKCSSAMNPIREDTSGSLSTPEPRRSERIQQKAQHRDDSLTKAVSGKELFREKKKENQIESEDESEVETEHEAKDLDNVSYEPNPEENTVIHQEIREQLTSIDIRKRGRDSPEPATTVIETGSSGPDGEQASPEAAIQAVNKKVRMTQLEGESKSVEDDSSRNQSAQPLRLELAINAEDGGDVQSV